MEGQIREPENRGKVPAGSAGTRKPTAIRRVTGAPFSGEIENA